MINTQFVKTFVEDLHSISVKKNANRIEKTLLNKAETIAVILKDEKTSPQELSKICTVFLEEFKKHSNVKPANDKKKVVNQTQVKKNMFHLYNEKSLKEPKHLLSTTPPSKSFLFAPKVNIDTAKTKKNEKTETMAEQPTLNEPVTGLIQWIASREEAYASIHLLFGLIEKKSQMIENFDKSKLDILKHIDSAAFKDLKQKTSTKSLEILKPQFSLLLGEDGKKIVEVDLHLWAKHSALVQKIMFGAAEFKEKKQNKISFPTLSPSLIKSINHFLITDKLEISREKLGDLLSTATYLDMPALIDKSKQILKDNVEETDLKKRNSLSSVIYLWKIAKRYKWENEILICEKRISKFIAAFPNDIDSILKDLKIGEVQLNFLDLSRKNTDLYDATLIKILEAQPYLTYLNLAGCADITDKVSSSLKKLPLTFLDISKCYKLTDGIGLILKKMVNLASLSLAYCNFSNKIGEYIEKLPLTSLNLSLCSNITDAIGLNLEKITTLTYLNLCDCGFTDLIGPSLEKLTNLAYLNLTCYKLTDDIGTNLEKLINLTDLTLATSDDVTNAILFSIEKLTRLTKLSLRDCSELTNAIGSNLEKLKGLTCLDLMNCRKLTDIIGLNIEKLTNLTFLSLYGCRKITDLIGSSLEKLINLKFLDITFCQKLTDALGFNLQNLIHLESLDISLCKGFTDGLAKSLKKLPLNNLVTHGCNFSPNFNQEVLEKN